MKRFGGTYARLIDDLVRERTGIATGHHRDDAEQRVFSRAMRRAGVSDEAVYLALLRRDDEAFDDLLAELTVPETYFFRDPSHCELLRTQVLPAIVRGRAPEEMIEVWSAGCASGEEPYSLAILLEQELLGHRSQVLGSDLSVRSLARAKRAVYSRWSLRAATASQVTRYFESVGREYRLTARIRDKARFVQHNLSASPYPEPATRPTGFDLILCRNVLIYFEPRAVAEVGRKLARALRIDGWLMLGPSDPVLDVEDWCEKVVTPCGLLYRRRHASRPASPKERAAPPPGDRPALPRAPEPARRTQAAETPRRSTQDPVREVREVRESRGLVLAEAACRELLSREPLHAALQLLHGSLLMELDRGDDAERALRRALYLDRTLLMAQMWSAMLAEQRGECASAQRLYAALAHDAALRAPDESVLLGDGLTHGALSHLAELRARALRAGPV